MIPRQWFRALGSVAPAIMFATASVVVLAAAIPAQAQAVTAPTTLIGSTSSTQTATVTITAPGTLSTIAVLTQGATGLDYAIVPGGTGTCAATTPYTAGQTCTVQFTFTPSHPWTRYGGISLFDGSGNLLGNTFIVGVGTGPQVSYPLNPATVPASLSSAFTSPSGIAIDGSGNVYIADTSTNAVMEIMAVGGAIPSSPAIRTLGSGFSHPSGVAVDGSGNVYVADTNNSLIKEIVAVSGVVPTSNPTILTLAPGFTFSGPTGVAVDGSGNVYVADTAHNAVEEIVAVNGVIPASPTVTTLGSGFSLPTGVAVDASGDVFVADSNHNAVKEIVAVSGTIPSSPTITTISSSFSLPNGIALDGSGDLYVADTGNNAAKLILAVGGTIPSGPAIITLGSGFTAPGGVAVDASGDVFVADSGNGAAKEMNDQTTPTLSFATTAVGGTSTDSPQAISVANDGNAPLVFSIPTTGSNPGASANFSVGAGSSCPQVASNAPGTASLAAGGGCTDILSFTPVQVGTSGTLTSTDNNLNAAGATQVVALTGTATPGTLTVNVAPASAPVNSTSVSLSATVAFAGVAPTGPVTFTVNGGSPVTASCTTTPTPLTCTATFNPTGLTVGTYPIVASATDTNYNLATGNGTLTITQAMPTLMLSTSGSPSTVDGLVTFTVAVSPSTGITPSGRVTVTSMLNGTATPLCTPVSPTGGTVSCQTSALLAGPNSISASIALDTNFTTATSNSIAQTVNPATTTLALASSQPASSSVDQSVSFTATLSSAAFTPTPPSGKVSFSLNGNAIAACSGTNAIALNSSFKAACALTNLIVPSDTISATYLSDPNFATSSATPLGQLVSAVTPVTSINSSATTSSVNQSVTFTATITPAAAPGTGLVPVSGSVSFYKGSATGTLVCGPAVVTSSNGVGTAACSYAFTSAIPAGTAIYAVYSGDTNFTPGNTPSVLQTVTIAPTTTTINPSVTQAAVNQSVTFTESVAPANTGSNYPGTALPQTGMVTFTDSLAPATPICTSNLAGGVLTPSSCVYAFTSLGSHVVTATFTSTDPNFSISTSNSVTVTVGTSGTTLSASVSGGPSAPVVNQQNTFQAAFTNFPSGLSASPGSVGYFDSGNAIQGCASLTVTASGSIPSCTETLLSAGSHSISVVFTPSSGSALPTLSSNAVAITVAQNTTTVAITAPAVPTSSVDQLVTFAATVTPKLLSPAAVGTTIPTNNLVFTAVLNGVSSTLCTAAVSTSAGITSGACQSTLTLAGAYTITASYSGDLNFQSSTGPQIIQTVAKTGTSLSVTLPTPAPAVNQLAAYSAQLSPAISDTATGDTMPTGLVTFTDGTAGPVLCSVQVAPTGSVTCPQFALGTAVSHSIVVSYAGDSNFSSSTITVSETIGLDPTTVTVPTPSASQLNQAVTFNATIAPTYTSTSGAIPSGTVTYTDTTTVPTGQLATTNSPCVSAITAGTVAPCILTFNFAGSHTITAVYSGDTNFSAPTTAPSITQSVIQGTTTVALVSSSPTSVASTTQAVTFTATITGSSTGATVPTIVPTGTAANVSFTITQGSSSLTCTTVTVVGNTVKCPVIFGNTLLPASSNPGGNTLAGAFSVTAAYLGDSNFKASPPATNPTIPQTIQNFIPVITPGSITLSQANTNLTDPYYTNQPIALKTTPLNGFSDAIKFTCTVTSGTTVVADPSCTAATTGTTGTATITASAAAPVASYNINFTVTDTANPGLSQTWVTPLTVLNQAGVLSVPTLGSGTATFTSLATGTFACTTGGIATLSNGVYSISATNPVTLAAINVSCSTVTGPSSGLYSVTFTAGKTGVAQLEVENRGIVAAGLGIPFLLIVGLLPATGRLRKTLLRSLAIVVLGILAMQATGCSSGGFSNPGLTTTFATPGSYLVGITNGTQTVAEIPLVVGN